MTYGELSMIGSLVGSAATALGLVARGIAKIKNNHLKHMDEKLDTIIKAGDANAAAIVRVEEKLDTHVQYHLEHKL